MVDHAKMKKYQQSRPAPKTARVRKQILLFQNHILLKIH